MVLSAGQGNPYIIAEAKMSGGEPGGGWIALRRTLSLTLWALTCHLERSKGNSSTGCCQWSAAAVARARGLAVAAFMMTNTGIETASER